MPTAYGQLIQPHVRQLLALIHKIGVTGGRVETRIADSENDATYLLARVCAVKRRRFSSGCKPHPATAPAGSNRSRHGGDEMSEAFG